MKNFLLVLVVVIFCSNSKAQILVNDYELFSIGVGHVYSVEDKYCGFTSKLNISLGANVNLVAQSSYFPDQFQNPKNSYREARTKFNIEVTPVRMKKLYLSLQGGFDFGYWKRTHYIGPSLDNNWNREKSMMYGCILNYNLKKYRLFAEHTWMPGAYRNHSGIGISILFFENHKSRKAYLKRNIVKRKKRRRNEKT